jgi:hypothetical protein
MPQSAAVAAEESLHAAIVRIAARMGLNRKVGVLIAALADGRASSGSSRP